MSYIPEVVANEFFCPFDTYKTLSNFHRKTTIKNPQIVSIGFSYLIDQCRSWEKKLVLKDKRLCEMKKEYSSESVTVKKNSLDLADLRVLTLVLKIYNSAFFQKNDDKMLKQLNKEAIEVCQLHPDKNKIAHLINELFGLVCVIQKNFQSATLFLKAAADGYNEKDVHHGILTIHAKAIEGIAKKSLIKETAILAKWAEKRCLDELIPEILGKVKVNISKT